MSVGSIGIQMMSATTGSPSKSPPSAANNGNDAVGTDSGGPATPSAPAGGTGSFVDKTA
jgi:hypothetical protein